MVFAKQDIDPANKQSGAYAWMTFLGIALFLLGIFASAHTIINLAMFDKYPQAGVIPISLSSYPAYYPRELDCQINYPPSATDVMVQQTPFEAEVSTELNESTPSVTPSAKTEKTEKEVLMPPIEEKPITPDAFIEQQKKACQAGVEESRQQAKTNDIVQSLLFLFLGGGLLKTRRKFFA